MSEILRVLRVSARDIHPLGIGLEAQKREHPIAICDGGLSVSVRLTGIERCHDGRAPERRTQAPAGSRNTKTPAAIATGVFVFSAPDRIRTCDL
jgi:hypothetical protein